MKSCAVLLLALAMPVLAADFPTPYDSEKDLRAKPLTPEEAAAAYQAPPGMKVNVFAAEPDVRNPIAAAWDRKGRMWVAENYTYAERELRFDLNLRDRLLILEDTDGDGKAEKPKVFSDQLQMLTSVEIGKGGVWVMCPPQLLFIPDANGDDIPDGPPIANLDGFTVAQSNYHNLANGLRWGPDGWLYGRVGHSCPGNLGVPGTPDDQRVPVKGGIWRFDPDRGVVEVLTHGTTNPWGHDWDQHGEGFFINTVNGHLWHLIPGAHFKESGGNDPNPAVFERLDHHADHWHYDTGKSWADSRNGMADSFGGGHAHCGVLIYQGLPESLNGKLMTLNLHGRRVNVERLERYGAGYIGRHEPDILQSKDPWFRGIDLIQGPGGAVYILDYSDTGECHENTGVHRNSGRIFRVSHGDAPKTDLSMLANPSVENVMALHQAPEWYYRQARRIIQPDRLPEDMLKLWKDSPVYQLRVMWSLHAGGKLSRPMLTEAMKHPNEHVRAWAIRLLMDKEPLDTGKFGPLPHFQYHTDAETLALLKGMARDPSGLVRLTLASSLQRLPVAERASLAALLAARAEDAKDHNLPSMIWYGMIPAANANPAVLTEVAQATVWPDTLRWMTRYAAGKMEKNPAPLNDLLTLAMRKPATHLAPTIAGLSEAMRGRRKAPKPANWDAIVSATSKTDLEAAVLDLSAVFGDGRALDQIQRVALDPKADLLDREAALRTLIDAQPANLREVCEKLISERGLTVAAARGLAKFEDGNVGTILAKSFPRLGAADRPALMEVMVSRKAFASAMLDAMASGAIKKAELSAFQARQLRALSDDALNARLVEIWGELRDSSADKAELMAKMKSQLTPQVLASANLPAGRQLYAGICAACHKLYGEGGIIGPNLTGSGRANLDYLLENIVDPSAVVSADYRMTMLKLKDGRILSGVSAGQTEQTVTVQTPAEKVTVEKSGILETQVSPVSMMPEGLLQVFSAEQVRDLIAYLMHPSQVPLE